MRKNNMGKLKSASARAAPENRSNKSIPSKKANSGKRISTNGSDTPRKPVKNTPWAKTLQEHPELDQLFDKGIQKKRQGSFRQAAKILEKVLKRYPDQAPVLWYLGGIYLFDLDLPKKALALFQKARRLAPHSERASLGLFHSLWTLGRERAAMKELLRFQQLANCSDYDEILAEVQEKAPELLASTRKKTVASSNR